MGLLIVIVLELVLAGLVGWVTGKIMHFEVNVWLNVLLGIAGGIIGSFITGLLGIKADGLVGGFIISVLGAFLLVWLFRFIRG